jgi:hypothetical protein
MSRSNFNKSKLNPLYNNNNNLISVNDEEIDDENFINDNEYQDDPYEYINYNKFQVTKPHPSLNNKNIKYQEIVDNRTEFDYDEADDEDINSNYEIGSIVNSYDSHSAAKNLSTSKSRSAYFNNNANRQSLINPYKPPNMRDKEMTKSNNAKVVSKNLLNSLVPVTDIRK